MSDKIVAAIRTGVAAAVSACLVWVANTLGVELPEGTAEIVGIIVFGLVVAVYNYFVSWLTENVWDGFGLLLGIPRNPQYQPRK